MPLVRQGGRQQSFVIHAICIDRTGTHPLTHNSGLYNYWLENQLGLKT